MKKLHQSATSREAEYPSFEVTDDLDYTTPYPCHVCHETFRSRHDLATHPHPKQTARLRAAMEAEPNRQDLR